MPRPFTIQGDWLRGPGGHSDAAAGRRAGLGGGDHQQRLRPRRPDGLQVRGQRQQGRIV